MKTRNYTEIELSDGDIGQSIRALLLEKGIVGPEIKSLSIEYLFGEDEVDGSGTMLTGALVRVESKQLPVAPPPPSSGYLPPPPLPASTDDDDEDGPIELGEPDELPLAMPLEAIAGRRMIRKGLKKPKKGANLQSVEAAAKKADCGPSTIRARCDDGTLPSIAWREPGNPNIRRLVDIDAVDPAIDYTMGKLLKRWFPRLKADHEREIAQVEPDFIQWEQFVSTDEAGERLGGISAQAVVDLIRRDALKAVRVMGVRGGAGSKIRVQKDSIEVLRPYIVEE